MPYFSSEEREREEREFINYLLAERREGNIYLLKLLGALGDSTRNGLDTTRCERAGRENTVHSRYQ